MKKKTKKTRKKVTGAQDNGLDVLNIVKDELYALSAIFGPEFEEDEDEPLSCSVLVVPHEARLEDNNVSVRLRLRFPAKYPSEPLELSLQEVQGLDVLTARKVAKKLHEAANEYAKAEEICGFQIIQLCQDCLQDLNEERIEIGPEAQLSLWEEMQRREQNEGSISTSERITFNFSGLFDESMNDTGMHGKESIGNDGMEGTIGQGGMNHHESSLSREEMRQQHSETTVGSEVEKSKISSNRSLSSLVNSMSSMKLSLPEAVRQIIDRSTAAAGGGPESSYSINERMTYSRDRVNEGACTEYTRIQRDFLIGRLLYEFKSDSDFSSHLDKMVDRRMVPFWLGNLLMRHPEMFKRAFKKVMQMPFESSGYEAFSDALVNFEKRAAASETAATEQMYTSRYKSDFQQIKILGRGGYGVVYLTLHKFDGRQYAVKQVFLSPDSGGEFDRIMREVQTLSRMQHNHIVRYYAAWMEQRVVADESDDVDDGSFSGESWSDSFTDSGSDSNESATSEGSDEPSETENILTKRYLYIQMEFCPSTLKKMMDDGLLEDEFGRWKMVRQLLSCLSYVHSKGIIHRDLKPANIFVDSLGDLKLGDFGLAKFLSKNPDAKGRSGEVPSDLNPPKLSQTDGTTGVCGTSFYIAPEVESESRSYTEKVDIFSVGIIVVELWTRFSTEMERIVTLRDLRESGKLPKQFTEAHPNAAALASWLLQTDPSKRPTAHEALKSNLIPTTIGNEQLSDLLRSLPDNPQARERMVTALFQLQNSPGQTQQEAALSASELSIEFPDLDISLDLDKRNKVLETMIRVFKQFGAIQMRSMDVCRYDPTSSSSSSMTAMTPSGNFISLRYNLRSNFVNWVISKSILDDDEVSNSLRRFEISTVYRRVKGNDIPKPLMQADFDILFPSSESGGKYAPIAEAETMAAIANVLNSLDTLHDCWELRLGHVSIFPEIIARLEVAKDIQEPIYQTLRLAAMSTSPSSLVARSSRMRDLQHQLEELGLHRDVVARIKEFFVQCTGDLPSVLHRLSVLLPSRKGKSSATVRMRTWIDEIQATATLIEALGVQSTKVTIDPFITPHDEYFDGILFEFHALDPSESSKSTMLAAGGRFDQLLRERWAKTSISNQRDTSGRECPCNGYGATINIERILSVEVAPSRQTFSPSQVLVCSKGTGSNSTKSSTTKLTDRAYSRIEKKARILKILRDCGISAEIMPTSSPSMTQQFAYANSRSIPWLVIFDLDDANGIVSLKHLKGKYEEDVSLSDLGHVLKLAMGHTILSPIIKQ